MKYQEVLIKHSPLSKYAVCVWTIEGHEDSVSFRHIPKCQSMLVFSRGGNAHIEIDGQHLNMPRSFIMPVFNTSTKVWLRDSHLMGVSFINDGLYRLMKRPIGKMGFAIPVSAQRKLDHLWQALKEQPLSEASIVIKDYLLNEMLLDPGPVGFDHAIALIKASHGCKSISQICLDAAISERSLQRHFKERIGISPKQFSKITRVNNYLNSIMDKERNDWMQTVVSLNYHDQPHLVNEFKSIVQLSPRDLMKYQDSLYQQLDQLTVFYNS